MFRNIQWKIVIIYFLLVFLAMEIIGLYIINELEQYHKDNLTTYLHSQASFIEVQIKNISLVGAPEIQKVVTRWYEGTIGSQTQIREVYILNGVREVIASTEEETIGRPIGEVLNSEPSCLLLASLTGKKGTDIIENDNGEAYLMDYAFPIKNSSDKVEKIIYLRAGMEEINKTLSEAKNILTYATIIALIITVFLGSLLARSITGPIKEVTSKAQKMAQGDFDHRLEVKSNDEIGQLTQTFNYMAGQLKDTLGEIAGEKGKMEAIFTYMTDGVIAVNDRGEIIHANPSALKFLGIEDDEVSEKNLDLLFSKTDIDMTFEQVKTFEDIEDNIIKVNDIVLKVEVAPFKNEEQEIMGYIMVLQDITEQHKLETMRKEFVANVSHELRTPLTSIRSYIETLLEGVLEEDQELSRDFLRVVNSEAMRMTRLVKDLLQLSRLDYQQTEWNKYQFDLEEMVEQAVIKLEMAAKEKGHTIAVEKLSSVPIFEGDKDRIEQVILNIVSNAIKYTPNGGAIKVIIDYVDGNIRIIVEDNGIGIPENDLSRIFERFYRVDKARSRELGGTGLGLSIAKQIIEAHEGDIDINSVQGEGTTVTIQFPA